MNKPIDFQKWRHKNIKTIELYLAKAIDKQQINAPPHLSQLFDAMRYCLLGGGKRLRPLLTLATAKAVGGQEQVALGAAAAIEMVHTYSLIHDDLPAMDDDEFRRGRPCCHKVFGEAMAILAGDALLSLAFETMLNASSKNAIKANKAALVLAKASGARGMVGGQVLDISLEKNNSPKKFKSTQAMVTEMEILKTGELIGAALSCGAIMAQGKPMAVERLANIGRKAGLAFQIKDDILNQSGDPNILGKATGSDAARGKSSFSAIFGLENAQKKLAALIAEAQEESMVFKENGLHLRLLITALVERQN
ncbi:MAG: polyprenyl synthetase family protein [Candidatus Adiutrix sp.]